MNLATSSLHRIDTDEISARPQEIGFPSWWYHLVCNEVSGRVWRYRHERLTRPVSRRPAFKEVRSSLRVVTRLKVDVLFEPHLDLRVREKAASRDGYNIVRIAGTRTQGY